MKTLLKTSYPCLIKTDNDMCELEENDTLEIEEEEFLFVYPQNGNIPFYIDTKSEIENRFVSIIKHEDKKIYLLEKGESFFVEKKQKLNFLGKTCEICVANNWLSFETEGQKVKFYCSHPCKQYEVFKHKNFAYLKFEKDFYAFCTQKNKLYHFSGDSLTFENGELVVTKKIHDSNNREKTSKYKFDDELTLEDEAFISSKVQTPKELLPFKAMESIKAKDYAFILNSLSDRLKNQIDAPMLNQFFGNITSFLPLTTSEFITLSKSGKNYVKFTLSNDKIDDISIDNL